MGVAPLRKRKPTQIDVARAAGVSQTTVSLVLNNSDTPSVPEETRNKVLEAIRTLSYVPNSNARTLRTSRTFTMACIIPMITNPFYPAFVSGVQSAAEQNGYDVITYNTHGSAEKEAKFLESVQQGRVDGVIGVFFYSRANHLAPLFEKNIPVVRLEVRKHSVGDWPLDNIFVDNAKAAFQATEYLIQRGHRRIAMITGPAGPRDARREGYLQALERSGLALDPRVIEVDDYSEQGGSQGTQALLAGAAGTAERCTAIFAANDLMAIGAMKAIRDHGLQIPQEMAVVGFDDIPAAAMVSPALTTIRQHQDEMGRMAARLLIQRLSGEHLGGGREIEMPFELVVRDST
jgi:LacI family transcriptional regulator